MLQYKLVMITRFINISKLTNTYAYCFSSGLFAKNEHTEQTKEVKRPLFSKFQPEKDSEGKEVEQQSDKQKFTSSQTLDYLVNKINEVNNYYLGVNHNTKYLKISRSIKYKQAVKLKAENFKISDFPVELLKQENKSKIEEFDKYNQNEVLSRRVGQLAFSHCRLEPFTIRVQQIVQKYFLSLGSEERFTGLEPNFELQNIKNRNAYKDKLNLLIKNQEAIPQIKIKDITLLKGISAIRNENYSTDSYSKDQSELADGFISYTLYRQKKQRYPEREWLTTKFINARFEILAKGGPVVEVKQNSNFLGSTQNTIHNLVVEVDLIPPPSIAEHQLTPQQYLRSYRLVPKSLVLTNFDRKNEFYSLTYSEAEKKDLLYNRIQ